VKFWERIAMPRSFRDASTEVTEVLDESAEDLRLGRVRNVKDLLAEIDRELAKASGKQPN